MILMPKDSAKFINLYSKNVFIENEGVKNVAYAVLKGFKDGKISVNNFSQCQFHPSPEDPKAVDWIFILNTLNYSFWNEKNCPKWTVNNQTGYFALCAAIKRAINEGKPIVDPKYYSQITRSEAEYIFRGDTETNIPLLDERVKCLRDAGKVLLEKYQGTFVNCVKLSSHSAQNLLRCIVKEFESYQDEADYKIHRVSFYKRAQILVGDIWACFKGEGIGEFWDIDYLTMFADYRIPQILLHFGAIRYSNTLMSKLESDIELENGSDEEIEIRGCTIEVIERVKYEVKDLIERCPKEKKNQLKSNINSVLIDHFLWNYRREHEVELEIVPYHKTRCIYY
ncbi:queuosine salvage protein isoform X2 [Apis laboriosa]|uniref:queuosine salvage protein isoform X2 n=1 Tax=Apis laboriosa TaxID=183418 RepID=UPI001CC6C044|nr:queuosine salvage protein isoform X2 [Apis laboriosa]